MGRIVEPAKAGAHGFDANSPISKAKAVQFRKAGFAFAVRYLSRKAAPPPSDLTKAEVAAILDGGLALMAVQHVEKAGWKPSATLGKQYGINAAAHAKAVSLPAGTAVFLDVEEVSGAVSPNDIIAYSNEWHREVQSAGYVPGVYVGPNCGLTSDQLYHQLKMTYYWKSGSKVPPLPHRGWCMVQSFIPHDSFAGIGIDRDVITPDEFGLTPPWARAEGQVSASAGPAPAAAAVPAAAPAVSAAAVPAAAPLAADAADGEAVLRGLASNAGVSQGMERLIAYRGAHRPTSNPRYWAVVNFDLHSAKPRLFLFDRVAGTVASYLCAHGQGSEGKSDDGFASVFSNVDGSHCSSLGIYNCAEPYIGAHGKSLHLDGLEATNSNARHRNIVIHGAAYVSQKTIAASGRIGRSHGCPAVEQRHVTAVVDALRGGSLMIIWKS